MLGMKTFLNVPTLTLEDRGAKDCGHRDAESETAERLVHHKTVLSLRLQNLSSFFIFENAAYSQESSSPYFLESSSDFESNKTRSRNSQYMRQPITVKGLVTDQRTT